MKQILTQLKKQRENLVKQAEKRDEYYQKRSEDWKSSATGRIYEDKTSAVADIIIGLDDTISELKHLLNDC